MKTKNIKRSNKFLMFIVSIFMFVSILIGVSVSGSNVKVSANGTITYQAQIGSVQYPTLGDALSEAAKNNKNDLIEIISENVTFNLSNGNTTYNILKKGDTIKTYGDYYSKTSAQSDDVEITYVNQLIVFTKGEVVPIYNSTCISKGVTAIVASDIKIKNTYEGNVQDDNELMKSLAFVSAENNAGSVSIYENCQVEINGETYKNSFSSNGATKEDIENYEKLELKVSKSENEIKLGMIAGVFNLASSKKIYVGFSETLVENNSNDAITIKVKDWSTPYVIASSNQKIKIGDNTYTAGTNGATFEIQQKESVDTYVVSNVLLEGSVILANNAEIYFGNDNGLKYIKNTGTNDITVSREYKDNSYYETTVTVSTEGDSITISGTKYTTAELNTKFIVEGENSSYYDNYIKLASGAVKLENKMSIYLCPYDTYITYSGNQTITIYTKYNSTNNSYESNFTVPKCNDSISINHIKYTTGKDNTKFVIDNVGYIKIEKGIVSFGKEGSVNFGTDNLLVSNKTNNSITFEVNEKDSNVDGTATVTVPASGAVLIGKSEITDILQETSFIIGVLEKDKRYVTSSLSKSGSFTLNGVKYIDNGNGKGSIVFNPITGEVISAENVKIEIIKLSSESYKLIPGMETIYGKYVYTAGTNSNVVIKANGSNNPYVILNDISSNVKVGLKENTDKNTTYSGLLNVTKFVMSASDEDTRNIDLLSGSVNIANGETVYVGKNNSPVKNTGNGNITVKVNNGENGNPDGTATINVPAKGNVTIGDLKYTACEDGATFVINTDGSVTLTSGNCSVNGGVSLYVQIQVGNESKTVKVETSKAVAEGELFKIDANKATVSVPKSTVVVDGVTYTRDSASTSDSIFSLDITNGYILKQNDFAMIPAGTAANMTIGTNKPIVSIPSTNNGTTQIFNYNYNDINCAFVQLSTANDTFKVGLDENAKSYKALTAYTIFIVDQNSNVILYRGSTSLSDGESIICSSGKTIVNPVNSKSDAIIVSYNNGKDNVVVAENGIVTIDNTTYKAGDNGATFELDKDSVKLIAGSVVLDQNETVNIGGKTYTSGSNDTILAINDNNITLKKGTVLIPDGASIVGSSGKVISNPENSGSDSISVTVDENKDIVNVKKNQVVTAGDDSYTVGEKDTTFEITADGTVFLTEGEVKLSENKNIKVGTTNVAVVNNGKDPITVTANTNGTGQSIISKGGKATIGNTEITATEGKIIADINSDGSIKVTTNPGKVTIGGITYVGDVELNISTSGEITIVKGDVTYDQNALDENFSYELTPGQSIIIGDYVYTVPSSGSKGDVTIKGRGITYNPEVVLKNANDTVEIARASNKTNKTIYTAAVENTKFAMSADDTTAKNIDLIAGTISIKKDVTVTGANKNITATLDDTQITLDNDNNAKLVSGGGSTVGNMTATIDGKDKTFESSIKYTVDTALKTITFNESGSVKIGSITYATTKKDTSFSLSENKLVNDGDMITVEKGNDIEIILSDDDTSSIVTISSANTGDTTITKRESSSIVKLGKANDYFTFKGVSYTATEDNTEFNIDANGNVTRTITSGSIELSDGDSVMGTSGKLVSNPEGSKNDKITLKVDTDNNKDIVTIPALGRVVIDGKEIIGDSTKETSVEIDKEGNITIIVAKPGSVTVGATTYSDTREESAEGDNIKVVIGADGKINVVKPTPATPTTPTISTILTYGDNLSNISLSDNWTWDDETIMPSVLDSNKTSYSVKVKVDDVNYDWSKITGYKDGYYFATVQVSVNKATFDMSGVTFNNSIVTYDGKEHSILVNGTLPNGVTVTYEGNEKTNSGVYSVVAKFTYDTVNYNFISDMNATLTIEVKDIKDAEVKLGKALTYNGSNQTQTITSVTVDGLSVTYDISNNVAKKANKYTLTITGTGNFIGTVNVSWSIAKAQVAAPKANTGLVYTGEELTGIEENSLYTVTNGKAINAGSYKATVTLTDTTNYEWATSFDNEITWSIAKATYDMSGVSFNDVSVSENNTTKSIYISGNLPNGVSVSYEGNDKTSSGIYTVTAKFIGDYDNYNVINDMYATLTINQAIIENVVDGDDSSKANVIVSKEDGIDPNVQLVVVKQEEVPSEVKETVKRNETVAAVYDISLNSEGVSVQPNGTITIKILLDDETSTKSFRILHLHEGNVEEVEYTIENGYAVFSVDKLSEFSIVVKNNGSAIWLITLLAIVVVIELVLIIVKKRNTKSSGKKLYAAGLFGGVLPVSQIVLLTIFGIAAVVLGAYVIYLYIPRKKACEHTTEVNA